MRIFFATLLSALTVTSAAYAVEDTSKLPGNTADIAVYAGKFSVGRDPKDRSVELGAEYRFKDQWYGLRPTVGIMGNTDSAVYGYAGINWDLPIPSIRPIVITPGVKVGGYSQGDSKDLGYGVEFRDSIEATYRFDDGQRAGLAYTHMSNASLGDKNPGVEIMEVVYSHPM